MQDVQFDVLASIGEAVAVVDDENRIQAVNAAFSTMMDAPESVCVGQDIAAFGVPGGRDADRVHSDTPDGGVVEWAITPAAEGCVYVGRRAATAAPVAASLDTDRQKLLAMVSHELRTPAAGMIGMAELLAATRLDGRQAAYADALVTGGRHLLSLIEQTLEASKLQAGAFELDLAPTDPSAAVVDAVRVLHPRAAEKGLTLMAVIDPSTPNLVQADAARLRQIVFNLAGNAVKFTDAGGVVVDLENQGVDADGMATLRLSVRDTGPGVPASQRERIFQAFQRADDPTTARAEGAGLGLAITAKLAEAMDGALGLDSEEGGGAVFWAILRFRVDAPADAAAASVLRGQTLCVGSEDALICDALARQLAAYGAQIRLAGRPDHVDADKVDVILAPAEWAGAAAFSTDAAPIVGVTTAVCVDQAPAGYADMATILDGPDALVAAVQAARRSGVDAPPDRRSGRAAAETPTQFHLRALLVEDDPVNRLLARTHLERLGLSVTEAETGGDGLSAIGEARFDILFLDLRLPGVDGAEIARRVRAGQEPNQDAFIVALTANSDAASAADCRAAGMDAVLTKPVSQADLVTLLTDWTQEAGRARVG